MRTIFGWLCVWVCIAGPSFAQQVQQPLSDEIRQREQRNEARVEAQTAEPGLVIATEKRAVVSGEEFCLPIASIQVDGVTVLPDEQVNAVISEYSSTCMGPAAIDTLLQVLSDLYVERGYITSRAYIPEQDLADGILDIVVVEGRIEDIIFINAKNGQLVDQPNPRRVRSAVPLNPGDLLELRALEQGIDQMNAPGGSTVSVDIQPGQDIGGSFLVITAEDQDPWRGAVQFQSQNADNTTNETLGVSISVDNLLNANDVWTFGLNGGLDSNALSFGVRLPARNWTWDLGRSYSEQLSQLTVVSELFEQTTTTRFGFSALLSRNETQKTFVGVRFANTKIRRSVNGVALENQRNRTLALNVDKEITGEGRFTGYGVNATGGRRRGGDSFSYIGFSGRHLRGLSPQWSLYSTLDVQFADSPVPNENRFFVGGGGLVRGFESASSSGDSGFAITNEFSFLPQWKTECCVAERGPSRWLSEAARGLSPYAFLDAGYVKNKDAESASIISAGIGVRTTLLRANLDISVGYPLSAEGTAVDVGPGIRFSLSRKVF